MGWSPRPWGPMLSGDPWKMFAPPSKTASAAAAGHNFLANWHHLSYVELPVQQQIKFKNSEGPGDPKVPRRSLFLV